MDKRMKMRRWHVIQAGVRAAIMVGLLCQGAWLTGEGVAAVAQADLFPFVVNPWEVSPANITNVSQWLDKPAGKDGFVTIKDGSFTTATGRRLRFLGVNFSYGGNFPTHDEADQLAQQLARYGINLVRFHHMDRYEAPDGIWKPGSSPRQIDEEQLDRLDYFVARLKENGIYANFNLKVARTYQAAEGFALTQGRPSYDKGLDIFHPAAIGAQQSFAAALLLHRNLYTGNRYVDEPGLAQIEITNEDSLFYTWQRGELDKLPSAFLQPLDQQWQTWLTNRYGSTQALAKAWRATVVDLTAKAPALGGVVGLPVGESLETRVSRPTYADMAKRTQAVQQDYVRFLWDTDQAFFNSMYNFIKNELGARNLVAGTQVPLSPPGTQALLDYVDVHYYWGHPQFTGANWDSQNWYITNNTMVNSDGGTIAALAGLRVAGKPYTVSEYNHPAPNTYGSEGLLLAGAYGAFQDWDGLAVFDWTLNRDYQAVKLTNYFNIKGHPAKLVTLPAVAAMFVRGDIAPGSTVLTVPLSTQEQLNIMAEPTATSVAHRAWSRSVPSTTVLEHRVERVLDGDGSGVATYGAAGAGAAIQGSGAAQPVVAPRGPQYIADTGELRWDRSSSSAGVVVIDSDRSKAVIGYGAGKTFHLSGLTLKPGPTLQNGWSAITFTVVEGSFAGPARLLMTATGYCENTGMVWKSPSPGRYTLTSWGTGPVLVEGIPAVVQLPKTTGKLHVYALDAIGNRRVEVPVGNAPDTTATEFAIGPQYKTLWYEIVIE